MSYTLSNAWAMAKEYPSTFEAPNKEELKTLDVGNFVKLCFDNCERMWVKITERHSTASGITFKGTLENDPIKVPMKYKDEVEFQPCHIYSTEK